ncbi:hypothetical protein B0H21DRAFT_684747 [Amylocystis lapponica]|nr:hypothetical protein B0H21DRAFT_684747 [Amylocystis lapponica]
MSHSNTASTSYTLAKYSRSYTQPTAGSSQTGAEWQHFVNPVIRLVLDIRKSSAGELESFRMRILWSLDAGGPDAMDTDQREEDLELLAFSSLPSFQERVGVPQGMPLKAVFRDCVVGIRYLHPRVYRRFQITFQSASWASGFIDMVRFVCPCKANPPPPPTARIPPRPTIENALPALPQNTFDIASSQVPADRLSASGLFSRATPNSSDDVRPSSAVTASSAMGIYHSSDPVRPQPEPRVQPQAPPSLEQQSHVSQPPSVLHPTRTASPASSAPAPQPPPAAYSSSVSSMAPPPAPPSSCDPEPVPSHPGPNTLDKQGFLASLEEAPSLYGLPRGDLERLVTKIVREEGFAKLLEDLDSMWNIKGFLGRNV